jgi:putative pyruvate formate lyase activating enzyme
MPHLPSYRARLTIDGLRDRVTRLRALEKTCVLCPRQCGAHRFEGDYGVCRATDQVIVSSASPHYGEEPPLVGSSGSGTIFFTSCNLKCQYCQNYDISQLRMGHPVSIERLADMMLSLQSLGCHNINLVSPTHYVPQIVEALVIAAERGLAIPLVYNCGGYESVATLRLLEHIVDIYMPDIKYSSNEIARRYSGARDYWDVVRPALKEMYRQVGDLELDDRGLAVRGLIIRHLVLPNGIAGSREVMDFIAGQVSLNAYVNIMDQYRPLHHAHRIPVLNRGVTRDEYDAVLVLARTMGLHRGFVAA